MAVAKTSGGPPHDKPCRPPTRLHPTTTRPSAAGGMSYYFCIVGAHDNPLYEADLSLQSNAASQGAGTSADGAASAASPPPPAQSEGGRTSMFGFGSALGALAGGLGNPRALMGGSATAPSGTGADAKTGGSSITADDRHMLQMIAYGSLDVLEDKQFVSNAMYVGARGNQWADVQLPQVGRPSERLERLGVRDSRQYVAHRYHRSSQGQISSLSYSTSISTRTGFGTF